MMPKIDLHCHLDGSLSEPVIRRLAARSGIELPADSCALNKRLSAPPDCQSLLQYLECFDLPVACLQTKENLFDAAKCVIEEAAGDEVIYMEVRFAPLLHKNGGLTTEAVIESVTEGVKEGISAVKATGKMMAAGVIVCGMRHMPVEENVRMLHAALKFRDRGICGVDIAGGEADYPPMVQKAFFEVARKAQIPVTIHAGECGSAENVEDAVNLGAARIGHGTALCKNPRIRQWVKEKNIYIEMCPTSNLQTKAVTRWVDYPFRMFMDEGLMVTVNTDNRTVSQTTMAREYAQLKAHCGMTVADGIKILKNSIEAAFAPEDIKVQLRQYVEECTDE